MKKSILSLGVLMVSLGAAASPAVTCNFELGQGTTVNATIAVVGPDQYGDVVSMESLNGQYSMKEKAKRVPTTNQSEKVRFVLDEGGRSTFSAMVFEGPSQDEVGANDFAAPEQNFKGKLFWRAGAVFPPLAGPCKAHD